MNRPRRPSPTPTEQQLADDVRRAEEQLRGARAKRDAYIRAQGVEQHNVSELARIFRISRDAVYKILRREPAAPPPREGPGVSSVLNELERLRL
jgi:hypothetical protein